jgi:hypothetical protein
MCNESDESDEDEDEMRNIALRRAASLEALQAYGGCFVSGFLAMQEPLPWLSTSTITSGSDSSTTSVGSPRPDSETLSPADLRDLEGRRRRWRGMEKLRKMTRKSKS